MKKLLIILLTTSIIVTSCKNDGDEKNIDDPEFAARLTDFDSLPPDGKITASIAKKLAADLKHIKIKKGDTSYYNRYNVANLLSLLKSSPDSTVENIRFYLGGIKKNNSQGRKQEMVIVILELEMSIASEAAVSATSTYYKYYVANPDVCPPPEPCLFE